MGIVSSVSQALGPGETANIKSCYLVEMDSATGNIAEGAKARSFQFFPETVNDSRQVQYEEKTMMGSSHPLYQWVHGSERTISFEAHFMSDGQPADGGTLDDIINAGTSLLKNPLAGAIALAKGAGGEGKLNIAHAIAWLRSFTYPSYSRGSASVSPPPQLLLYLEGTQIYSFIGSYTTSVIPVIMRRCDITYESFFRNGAIRSAMVSLEFAETIQFGSNWGYVDRDNPGFKAFADSYKGNGKNTVVIPKGDEKFTSIEPSLQSLF